jgi:hypothetical protein
LAHEFFRPLAVKTPLTCPEKDVVTPFAKQKEIIQGLWQLLGHNHSQWLLLALSIPKTAGKPGIVRIKGCAPYEHGLRLLSESMNLLPGLFSTYPGRMTRPGSDLSVKARSQF